MHILLAEKSSFSERGIQAFSEIAQTEVSDLTQEELVKRMPDFDILVIRLGLQVDARVLEAGKKLRIVCTPTTGLDHIDLDMVQRHGVKVLSLKGERGFLDQVYATAEHTFALLLSLIRRVPAALDSVKGYEWRRDLYRGTELNGKTLGLVGCGRLGTMVAGYGKAFGMQVLVYDPYQVKLPNYVKVCGTLKELLESSDVISLHATLNPETAGMMGSEQFNQVHQGSILINTARGGLVDENALLEALENGRLAGAALDVLENEHTIGGQNDSGGKITNPLLEYAREHNNLIITPHVGGATVESVEKADLFLANKLSQLLTTMNNHHR